MALAGTFHEAIAAHRGRQLDREGLARAFMRCPRVKAIAHYAQDLFRVREPVDSILVDTWLVFERVSLTKLDAPENVYKVLSATTRNVARTYRGKEASLPMLETDIEDDENSDSFLDRAGAGEQIEVSDDVAARLDTDRARAAFSAKLKNSGWPQDVPPLAADMLVSLPFTKAIRERTDKHRALAKEEAAASRLEIRRLVLDPDCAELARIRDALGITINDMAEHLGISVARLGTYLYGVVNKVPRDIMMKAYRLRDDYKGALAIAAQSDAELDKIDLDKLYTRWLRRLGLPLDQAKRSQSLRQLAEKIGRHPTAFHRWRAHRPKARVLRQIDVKVSKLAHELKPKKKVSEKKAAVKAAAPRKSSVKKAAAKRPAARKRAK